MFKKYLLPVFILAVVFFGLADNVSAAASDVFNTCPSSNAPLNTIVCSSGQKWIGSASSGSCKTLVQVESTINSCTTAKNDVYNCASNSCVCASGFPIDCRSVTPTPASCIASAMPTNPTCATAYKTTDSCGQCGGCISGYSLVGSICVQNCTGLNEIKAADGTCMSLEKVSKIMVKVFGLSTLSDLMNGFQTIIDNMTANPAYYLLTAQGTGTGDFTGQRLYQFGTGGDPGPNPKIRLEADWADEAWLADYLNWANSPTQLSNLFQKVAGVKFCTSATECGTGGSCVNSVCVGTVASDSTCDNTTAFCQAGLVCDVGGTNKCIASTGKISSPNITPGTNGQVLTTVSGATAWATPGAITDTTHFRGFSTGGFDATVRSSANPYYAMSQKCNTSHTGSHMCSTSEILYNYSTNNSAIIAQTGTALISNGPPGYIVFANDCNGWTLDTATFSGSPAYAAVWSFSSKNGSLQTCNNAANTATFTIACCGG
jgi:hypothetical protein